MPGPTVNDPLPEGRGWWRELADWIADGICAIARFVLALMKWAHGPR